MKRPSRIHVMHVITRMDMGGSAQNTLDSCIGLANRYDVTLCYGPTSESVMTQSEKRIVARRLADARAAGVRCRVIPNLFRKVSPIPDVLALIDLYRCMRRLGPDMVHTHSSKAGLIGRLAAAATGVPHVVHTPHGHVFYGHFGALSSHVFLMIERFMDRLTHVIVALTRGEFDDYIQFKVTSQKKLVQIHSGVDLKQFDTNRSEDAERTIVDDLPPDAIVVGTIGWLLPIKGPDVLIAAMSTVWRRHPKAHLVLIGKGPMESSLRAKVAATGRSAYVHFAGWREDVWNVLPLFDLFVLASRNEGMGRVLVEAMAAGKPVIGTNVGGIPDLIEHGVNGLLVPSEAPRQLASAICAIIGNPEKAAAMGRHGQRMCLAYSTESMIAKLDGLYQRLLDTGEVVSQL